jgi:hypothetical protein
MVSILYWILKETAGIGMVWKYSTEIFFLDALNPKEQVCKILSLNYHEIINRNFFIDFRKNSVPTGIPRGAKRIS